MEYEVSPDIREKEKIVGGILTATQTIFLGIGAILGGGAAVFTYSGTQSIALTIIAFLLGFLPFLPFGVVKIEKLGDMELFPYLIILVKYHFCKKIYVNINEKKRAELLAKK